MSAAPRLTTGTTLAYAVASLGSALPSLVLTSWSMYLYSPPEGEGRILIAAGTLGTVRFVERIFGAMLEPLIGHLSDKTRSPLGRRRPWIMAGAPLLVLAFALLWFPPDRPANHPAVIAHFVFSMVAFWTAYTAAVAPFLAMLPDLGADEAGRVRLSVWLGVFEVLANVLVAAGAGWLIDRGPTEIFGFTLDTGYQLTGIVVGLIAAMTFVPLLVFVREPPHKPSHDVHYTLPQSIGASLKNPLFLPYAGAIAGYRLATATATIGVPYIGTQLMGLGMETAGWMLGVITLIALVAFPLVQRWANTHGPARVFEWGGISFLITLPLMGTIGLTDAIPPVIHGVILFALSGFPVACVIVLPRALLAEVIDRDTADTGLQREAMYNGMSGVVEKIGEALAWALAGNLFGALGNSAAHPLGLRLVGAGAAVGVALGMIALRRYQRRRAGAVAPTGTPA